MSMFNKVGRLPPRTVASPVTTSPLPDTYTHQGAPGYTRDAKSELFLFGLSNMPGTDSFHETAQQRDARFTRLVTQVAVEDTAWLCGYLPWLRSVANMKAAPLLAAVDAIRAMIAAKVPGGRGLLNSVLRRPDAMGEAIAYHLFTYGRRLPIPLKQACADGAVRMYTEQAAVRYDTASHAVRFGDVIELCHPQPRDDAQAALFRALVDRAHHRDDPRYDGLDMLLADVALRQAAVSDPHALLAPGALARAGWRFQDALPYAGDDSPVDKKDMWTALIPLMGWEALMKNLAGFDRAKVGDDVAAQVADRLADPAQVRRAQVLPFQVLAAYENVPSLRWGHPLEKAMAACMSNIPVLAGRTLCLVDTSASMTRCRLSAQSSMTAAKAAAVFAVALAYSQPAAQVFGWADGTFEQKLDEGGSVLRTISAMMSRTGEVGHGTNLTGAMRDTYRDHDRVFVFTDEQSNTAFDPTIVAHHKPVYMFNLSGHAPAYAPSGGNVHALGGLSDATFAMVAAIESRQGARWPWECQPG
jgi:hypothetical protein